MWHEGKQTLEQALTPVGYIYENSPSYAVKETKKWSAKDHLYWCKTDGEDFFHYYKDGTFKLLSAGQCRSCEKTILPYTEKYYKKSTESGMHVSTLYCSTNGYCKECAEKLGSYFCVDDAALSVIDHFETAGRITSFIQTRTTYSDGSVVEFDSNEVPKQPVNTY